MYRVYQYGCLPPTENLDMMIDHMKKRNALWNKFVDIERDYRQKVQELVAIPDNPVELLTAEIESLREEIKSRRKAARKSVDISDLSTKVKELQAQRKEAYTAVKEKRNRLFAAHKDELTVLESERRSATRQVINESGLYWANSDEVNAAYFTARSKAMKGGQDLQYHRLDGSGKVSVRYQKGRPVADLFKPDTIMQIAEIPDEAWTSPIRSVRRKLSRSVVQIRLASNESHKPIWLTVPFVMHRPLPADGIIRSASIVREKLGNQYRYKLLITVAYEPIIVAHSQEKAVGIDVGWRKVNDGLRVAYWCDQDGNSGQLVLPHTVTSQFEKLKDLSSIRDKHFNDAINVLRTWMQDKQSPDWLLEKTQYMGQWRSKGKLYSLVKFWSENRFPGDHEIVSYLEEWRKREQHLWSWEFNLRDQIQKRRREIYRVFANMIIQNYSTVYMEDFDLQKVAKKNTAEKGTAGAEPMDYQRTIASVSFLRSVLESAAYIKGISIDYIESKYTTSECHVCGHIEKFDSATQIMRTCPQCGDLHDQDYNAAQIILKRGLSKSVQ